jgi:Flp pilus assembly protein TadG
MIRRQLRPREDKGAILPFVALVLVLLLGLASFAVDLGWFYLNSVQIQRAAEAAALGGVIHMPQAYATKAEPTAVQVAATNGYLDGVDGASITITDGLTWGEPNQIEVEISDTVDTFLLRVLGRDSQTITRSAVAEYVPPLPLGSPQSQFGNSCDPNEPGCFGQPNFWANIHGRYTDTRMGDAYSSYCEDGTGSGNSGCNQNVSWRNPATSTRGGGYLYGIEATAGNTFSVQFLDIVHHNISGGTTTNDNWRTGDRGCEAWGDNNANCGQTVRTTVYAPDPSPLNLNGNVTICTRDWLPAPQVPESDPYTWEAPWCTITPAADGLYVLQIEVLEPPMAFPGWSGLNRYSVRATGGARLYGLGDMSLYNNATGTISDFYLAEVSDIYSGKDFVVELYDPGEANPGGWVEIKAPNGPGSWTTYSSCRMSTRSSEAAAWGGATTLSPCRFFANNDGGANDYNGDWIKLEMTLSSYACGADCWWKLNYDYSNNVNDTTTWKAYIVGNPVHLLK